MSDGPIRIGHPDEGNSADLCGCCEGTALSTIRDTANRPNLSAIAFRAGDHALFKASMLTGLASAAYPALARLRTRDDYDFSIALIDAWAAACDVLTFYQERLANESYMGTATERLSIGELGRLIGYRLHPGAAAETDLVILMEDPPGAEPDVAELQVPEGTRVQSQPGPEEEAQVFETIEPLETRVIWNALRPRLTRDELPGNGDTEAWLEGLPNLQVGDAIVFIDRERWDESFSGFDRTSNNWNFRHITSVEPAQDGARTRITWSVGLSNLGPSGGGGEPPLQLYHLPERANFFGFNAPHPVVLTARQRSGFGFGGTPASDPPSPISGTADDFGDWVFVFDDPRRIHLDNVYKGFVDESWIVIRRPFGARQLYRIDDARGDSLARYAISGKTSRLTLDTDHRIGLFDGSQYRGSAIFGSSVALGFADVPETAWVAGDQIELNMRADGLPDGRRLIFRGKRAHLEYRGQIGTLQHDDGAVRTLIRGQIVTLMAEPEVFGASILYRVQDETGFEGTATEPANRFRYAPPPEGAEEIAVPAVLDQVLAIGTNTSRLELTEPLGAAFDRAGLTIHANVARAAHGEGVTEILGHGDPSVPFQKFLPKQAPVTHRLAPTESGVESTLSLRIDGVEWQEVPDLYERGATARVYKTALTDEGETLVEFGDGISGARPPAGRDNIVADHSRGLGAAGNLRAGQLKLPLDRPLGLKDVNNPLPATGGADAEAQQDARRNAPIYTLTLGRVVSLTDYRDFALGYPGIAKAEARWVWQGQTRRIVVTVAGDDGAEVPPGSNTHDNLLQAFRRLGDPLVGVDLLSYQPATFRLGLRVAVNTAYEPETVLAALEAHLRQAFSFAKRDLAALLTLSEVAAAAHEVAGVDAVDIDRLSRSTPPQIAAIAHARLISRPGRQGADGTLLPAEILTLHPGALAKLEVMS
ncbi:MAG: baseplate J/gp47 family protein [Paracoccaceae bacterium]